MTRKRLVITLLVTLSIALLAAWIGMNTSWEDVNVPMPPKGEALINPFYAAQRFGERLGAKTTWDRMLIVPSIDAVIVVSTWHWSLSRTRRTALERWVESGGRLVVDDSLIDSSDDFEAWSGIVRTYPDSDTVEEKPADDSRCRRVEQESAGRSALPDEEACGCAISASRGSRATVRRSGRCETRRASRRCESRSGAAASP